MKKLFLLLFVAGCINANAQTESEKVVDNSLLKNEIQLEMGESMRTLNLIVGEDMVSDVSPSFSISYHNRILKWLWLGVSVSYNQAAGATRMSFTNNQLSDYENFGIRHQLSVAPSIRFSYFNKYNLFMYSGGQFGMCWQKDPMLEWGNGTVNSIGPFWQVTLFGITYGKKFYLGGEFGLGNKGLFNFTAGYRF